MSSVNPLLTDESKQKIDHWLTKFPDDQKRSAIIAALTIAQDQNQGWITDNLLNEVADYLAVSPVWVYEVANFYSMFSLEPVGKHKISICNNISCMLCGADEIVDYVEKKLGITVGQTTADGRVTLIKEEECLAACVGAPMMIVDGHYHEKLTLEKVDQIIDSLD